MKNKLLFFILLVLSVLSLFVGVNDLGVKDLLTGLSPDQVNLIWQIRIPRLISILFAGMAMSISGLIMQKISQNKFVSPSTSATVDSAKFGLLMAIVVLKTNSLFIRMVSAFIFSLLGTYLFMKLIRKIKIKNQVMIPLIGIILGGIIDSISTFLAYQNDVIQNVSSWLQGDFSMIIKGRYELLFISLPLLALSLAYANRFTVAGMGEDLSTNLGLNYKQVVNVGLFIVSLLSSIVIITVGKIPFVGLIIPNIVSMIKGDNMEDIVVTTALFGALFLLISDLISRIILFPYELSISLTVGIIGSVVFLILLSKELK